MFGLDRITLEQITDYPCIEANDMDQSVRHADWRYQNSMLAIGTQHLSCAN